MESEGGSTGDPHRVVSLLRELDEDRGRLGELMKAPAWYGPLCGLLVAGLLLTPMIDVEWFRPVPIVLGVVVGFGLQQLYRWRVGITKRGPAGPLSATMVVITVGGMVVLYCAAWLSMGFGMPLLAASLAVSGFVLMWGLVVLNDRAVAWDMRHAG